MFRSNTVFVLGAGASAEVGLPVGKGLLQSISKLIDIKYDLGRMKSGDYQLSEALKLLLSEGRDVTQYNEHLHAAWQVIDSARQAMSIDYIVDGLENDEAERICKLGIVRAIHKAEAESPYFKGAKNNPEQLDLEAFNDTWYQSLVQLLTEGVRRSEIERIFDNFSIVSFNYDRCIEAYLPRAISSYYGVNANDVLSAFNEVPIFRPYGSAGKISWRPSTAFPVGFGGVDANYLANSVSGIRTFTQGVADTRSQTLMKDALVKADRVVFLGFAFHRQNMEILECELPDDVKVLATTSGISKSDVEVIKDEMSLTFSRGAQSTQPEFASVHCYEFFKSYWRTLTA